MATILVELFLELGWAAEINQRPCSLSVRWRRRQGNDHRQQCADGDRQYDAMHCPAVFQRLHASYQASWEPDSEPGLDRAR